MKNHAIIPIFIPHEGCPHDCVFCNQKKITAREQSPSLKQVTDTIERNLKTINAAGVKNIEIGFFGGSFTGIPVKDQSYYLSVAKEYKKNKKVNGIRLSTRPDYINEEILLNLKEYSVDLIELGVQSFDDEVLKLSERGHTSKDVLNAAKLIKDYGFDLGIQLMIGLPGDTREKSGKSAKELVKLKPAVARLYPTVVLKETKLIQMYDSGLYTPFKEEEMLETTTDMYEIIEGAGIKIIRIGLKSTDLINQESSNIIGDYHPAFSELVKGNHLYRLMSKALDTYLENHNVNQDHSHIFTFTTNTNDISKLVGHNGRNRKALEKKYPHLNFRFSGSNNIQSGSIELNYS